MPVHSAIRQRDFPREKPLRITHFQYHTYSTIQFDVEKKSSIDELSGKVTHQELHFNEISPPPEIEPLHIKISSQNRVENRGTPWQWEYRKHQIASVGEGDEETDRIEALWKINHRHDAIVKKNNTVQGEFDRGLVHFFGPPGAEDYMQLGEFIRYRGIRRDGNCIAMLSIPTPNGGADLFDLEISGMYTSTLRIQVTAANNRDISLFIRLTLPDQLTPEDSDTKRRLEITMKYFWYHPSAYRYLHEFMFATWLIYSEELKRSSQRWL